MNDSVSVNYEQSRLIDFIVVLWRVGLKVGFFWCTHSNIGVGFLGTKKHDVGRLEKWENLTHLYKVANFI